MQYRILGGANTIGGNCIEVESQGYRLLLDLGIPLGLPDEEELDLPDVPGLRDGSNPKLLGVVISHGHRDHYGLVAKAHPSTRYFIGEKAHQVLKAAEWFMRKEISFGLPTFLYHRVPISIGSFTVTPFLVDHSAFDAYAILVEADGKRLFYTGDLRGHGRKARLFEELLTSGPKDVDVLITEGTNLGRHETETKTEQELEEDILATIECTPGLVLAWFSPQNIDRLVTMFKATVRSGRIFVMDLYTACIMDALDWPTLPRASWDKVRVYVPEDVRRRIINEKRFDIINPYSKKRIFKDELSAYPKRFAMVFRLSMLHDLKRGQCPDHSSIIFSQWRGYLEVMNALDSLDPPSLSGIPISIHHTSGHASSADLERLLSAIHAGKVDIIHSDEGCSDIPTMQTETDSGLSNNCPRKGGDLVEK